MMPRVAEDISAEHIDEAAARLAGMAVRTPLLRADALDDRLGGEVFIKPETLQRTGSFKFRGAYNRISRLKEAGDDRAVIAYSSGNHAQGVAAAARLAGIAATIVMPADAPAIKVARTRAFGAEVIFYDRATEDRAALTSELAATTGALIVPPFDDPFIIAGQGTVGLEIARDMAKAPPDAVLVPAGGGGLIAGCALALKRAFPDVQVHAVEPEGFDDHRRSLLSGKIEHNAQMSGSICDALMSPSPGQLTFKINGKLLGEGFAVSDDEVRTAMRYAHEGLKLVVEPGGAVALAACLSGRFDARGKRVALVLSGGNVDPGIYREIIA